MSTQPDPEPPAPEVVIYTTEWCPQSRSAQRFLEEHGIPHAAIDIDEDESAAEHCIELNNGYRSTPTILINGEHAATEPTGAELRALFNIQQDGFSLPRWLKQRLGKSG